MSWRLRSVFWSKGEASRAVATTLARVLSILALLLAMPARAAVDPVKAQALFDEAARLCHGDGGALWHHSLCGPILLVDWTDNTAVADQADAGGVLKRSGTWVSFGDNRLGQGREKAREFLKENPQIAKDIEAALMAHFMPVAGESARMLPKSGSTPNGPVASTGSRPAPIGNRAPAASQANSDGSD